MAFGYKPWWQTGSWGATAAPTAPVVTGSRPQFDPFKPYRAIPPSGTYDPSLDAALGAARRGLGDLRQDTATGDLRAQVDLGLGREDVNRGYLRGRDDLDTQWGRMHDDYNAQVGLLKRSYSQLARRQAEGARAAGVMSGGIALQAAQKRAENMAVDRAPLDTQFHRGVDDNRLQRARLGDDRSLALGNMDLQYQRGVQDRGTALTRGEREFGEFKLDTGTQKAFQATGAGWTPPKMPKHEGVNRRGVAYREKTVNGWIYRYDRTGKVLSKRRAH